MMLVYGQVFLDISKESNEIIPPIPTMMNTKKYTTQLQYAMLYL